MDRAHLRQPLSDSDIRRLMGGKCKVVRYPHLHRYKSLSSLLGKHGIVFLLFETQPAYGHWTLVARHPDGVGCRQGTIEFFDSYGIFPDDERSFIPEPYRKASHQARAHLCNLLLESPHHIEYNAACLQAWKAGVNTCGRHCVARAVNLSIPMDQYGRVLRREAKRLGVTPDELVCRLVPMGP